MADMTVRIQGDATRSGVFTIARSGMVARADGLSVTEVNVTSVIRALMGNDHAELAGRVQGWWWIETGRTAG